MSRKQRVQYHLDSGGIKALEPEEIKAILRAADEIISAGGRNILAKILKGSKDKKVLEHQLNECPSYGFYRNLTLEEITYRIDWMIKNRYLEIDYNGRLPMIIFSDTGWEIEREYYADELLNGFYHMLETKDTSLLSEMKGKNGGLILLLIEKIRQKGDARLIPLLEQWKENEFKKVRKEIQTVILALQNMKGE